MAKEEFLIGYLYRFIIGLLNMDSFPCFSAFWLAILFQVGLKISTSRLSLLLNWYYDQHIVYLSQSRLSILAKPNRYVNICKTINMLSFCVYSKTRLFLVAKLSLCKREQF